MEGNKLVEVEGKDLFINSRVVEITKGFRFEGLPNRDSMPYVDAYGLDREYLKTMFRGTLKYQGYSELMYMLSNLGLFNTQNTLSGNISWVVLN